MQFHIINELILILIVLSGLHIYQPAVDSRGVLCQFYSDLFDGLAEGKLIVLFEGEVNRKVSTHRPDTVMSGSLEIVGKMISHSLAQGGPGFPFLASPCYYYLVACVPLHIPMYGISLMQ